VSREMVRDVVEWECGRYWIDINWHMTSYVRMKTAKVFANGRSRAVRIPTEWLKGADQVELRRKGDSVMISPIRPTLGELAEAYRKDPICIERKKQTTTPPKSIGL